MRVRHSLRRGAKSGTSSIQKLLYSYLEQQLYLPKTAYMTAEFSRKIMPETAISVAGITSYIKVLLEENEQLQQVWITGEVSSVKNHSSGLFFTLSEFGAAINCVIWKSRLNGIEYLPELGEQIFVKGDISLYAKRGDYKIKVDEVLPAGEGLENLRYLQLRSRLEAEGLFDPKIKRPLPKFPQAIAVVSSDTAAAWGDIQRSIKQRFPQIKIIFSPSLVQGEYAPDSIVKAIEKVNRDGRAEVLIIARGGGAVEDLACFNDERVVRAIANCSIPVITGIGHERDETLADLVADFRAHTPTKAAEIVVPDGNLLYREHRQRMRALIDAIETRFNRESERLRSLKQQLKRLPKTSRSLDKAAGKCQLLREKLGAIDPNAVLARGYAVVSNSAGNVIRDSREVVEGEELIIRLGEGKVKVKVTEVLE